MLQQIFIVFLFIKGTQSHNYKHETTKLSQLTDKSNRKLIQFGEFQPKNLEKQNEILKPQDNKKIFRRNSTDQEKNKSASFFAEFLAGIMIIFFALSCVWMNERKLARFNGLIKKAKDNFKIVKNIDNPDVKNTYELVFVQGQTSICQNNILSEIQTQMAQQPEYTAHEGGDSERKSYEICVIIDDDEEKALVQDELSTQVPLQDFSLGLSVLNVLKLERIVEYYQWVEYKTTEGEAENEETIIEYKKEWCTELVDSSHFEQTEHTNPKDKLFEDIKPIYNDQARLGSYTLQQNVIDKLQNSKRLDLNEYQIQQIIEQTESRASAYLQPKIKNGQILSLKLIENEECNEDEIGDIRVYWNVIKAGETISILAQQIEGYDKNILTFRPWNPFNIFAPYGTDNSPRDTISCPITCLPCYVAEAIFKTCFPEIVFQIYEGKTTPQRILDDMDYANQQMASFSRIFAWILNLVGHFLLFSPIIKLLAWIPLVGWLLAAIIKFAAVIFAIIWGSLLHLIVMCVAWIVYRPLIGAIMLVGIGVTLYIIFGWK